MKQTHQYGKAPITEAVIDIQTQPTKDVTPDLFDSLAKQEAQAYPQKSTILQGSVHVQMGPGGQGTHSTQQFLGVSLSNQSQKQLIQMRVNGFTISRLNPYEGWHHFLPEAQRLWKIYRSAVNPDKLTRVAVRFINRLDLPHETQDLSNYITMVPSSAKALGDDVAGFFIQLQLPQRELQAMLVLTEAKVDGPSNKLSILLDIDLFRDTDVPQSEDEIWQLLEKFHVRKNEIFEASITDKTRKLIDE